MRFRIPLALGLLALAAPLALGDISNGNVVPFGADEPGAPQAYCAVVKTGASPTVCYVADGVVGVIQILRVRVTGEAKVLAYVDGVSGSFHTQLARIDPCEAKPQLAPFDDVRDGDASHGPDYALCSKAFHPTSGSIFLYLSASGPGAASAAAWVERAPAASLP